MLRVAPYLQLEGIKNNDIKCLVTLIFYGIFPFRTKRRPFQFVGQVALN